MEKTLTSSPVMLNLFVTQAGWTVTGPSTGWIPPGRPNPVGAARPIQPPRGRQRANPATGGECMARPFSGHMWKGSMAQPQSSCAVGRRCRAWEVGSRGGMVVLIATVSPPPNFPTHGEPREPDATAQWALFGLRVRGQAALL